MALVFQGAGQVGGWIVERNGNVIADGAGTHFLTAGTRLSRNFPVLRLTWNC